MSIEDSIRAGFEKPEGRYCLKIGYGDFDFYKEGGFSEEEIDFITSCWIDNNSTLPRSEVILRLERRGIIDQETADGLRKGKGLNLVVGKKE